MTAPQPKQRWAELRRAAESRLRAFGADAPDVGLDQAQLIHELRVHQAELEMQNEELMFAQAETARTCIRYQRLYELAPVGCVTVDPSGRVRESNLRAAIMFGVAHSELGGKPLQKFIPELAADIFHRHLRSVFSTNTRQTCKIVLERRSAKTGSSPVRIESILVPDETAKRMLCQSVLINVSESQSAQQRPEGLMRPGTSEAETAADAIVGSDAAGSIDALHKAAERLESLRGERDFAERMLATAPVVVLVLDLDGRIVRFNHCLEEITGYLLAEVRGADWFSTFLPGKDHERNRGVFMRTLWGEITPATVGPIRTKTGSIVEIEWHSALLRDARGHTSAALSIGLDLTQRQQLEQA